MRLEVRPPTVNASEWQFTIADDRTLIYGLGAIKGVGEGAILALQEARQAGGGFRDLWDFCRRIDLQKMNRRVLEALVRSGALDELGANRATLMQHLPLAIRLAEQHKASHSSGQVDLFGMVEETASGPDPQLAGQVWGEWEEEERLQGEKETLGLYLTGHPVNRFEPELNALMGNRLNVLLSTPKGRGDREKRTVAGLVVGVRHGKTPRGRMASLVLDDRTGRLEVTVFSELYDQFRDLLAVDRLLVIAGTLNFDEFRDAWSLRASEVQTLEQAREKAADHLWLTLDLGSAKKYKKGGELLQQLREVLTLYRGGRLVIQLEYHSPQGQGRFLLGDDWRVQPTDELIKRLRQLLGQEAVKVAYGRFIGQSD